MTLNEYLVRYNMRPYHFADRFRFSKCAVYMWIKGARPNISNAHKIVKKTKGEITLKELGWHGY